MLRNSASKQTIQPYMKRKVKKSEVALPQQESISKLDATQSKSLQIHKFWKDILAGSCNMSLYGQYQ